MKIRIPDLSSRTEKLLIGTVILACGWIAFEMLLSPQYQNLYAAGQQGRVERMFLGKLENLEDSVDLRQEKLDDLNRQKKMLAREYFTLEQVGQYFSSLHGIAGQFGCRILSLDYESLSDMPNYSISQPEDNMSIHFRAAKLYLVGPYSGWQQFLEKIESNSRLIHISDFQIAPLVGGKGYLEARIQIVIPVFYDVIPEFQYVVEDEDFEEIEDDEE